MKNLLFVFKIVRSWMYKYRWHFLIALITLVVIVFPYSSLTGRKFLFLNYYPMRYNEIGDFIGGITAPVLSIVAIALIYKTYLSQRQELEDTRKAMKSQQATTTLFSMLNVFDSIASQPSITHTRKEMNKTTVKEIKGRKALVKIYEGLKDQFKGNELFYRYDPTTNLFEQWHKRITGVLDIDQNIFFGKEQKNYKYEYKQTGNSISMEDFIRTQIIAITNLFFDGTLRGELTHLFNYVEVIFDFIEREFESKEDKLFYYRIAVNHLSVEERALIFYYSFTIRAAILQKKLSRARIFQKFDDLKLAEKEHMHVYRYWKLKYKD